MGKCIHLRVLVSPVGHVVKLSNDNHNMQYFESSSGALRPPLLRTIIASLVRLNWQLLLVSLMPNIHCEYLLVDSCDDTCCYCDYVQSDCCGLVLSNVMFCNL